MNAPHVYWSAQTKSRDQALVRGRLKRILCLTPHGSLKSQALPRGPHGLTDEPLDGSIGYRSR